MEHFDAIICGSGPSGGSAANTLAKANKKVLILEKDILPRHKTCGGGMPMNITKFLYDIDPSLFVESEVKFMRHTKNFKDPFLAPINSSDDKKELSLYMVQRSVFDNAIVKNAVKAGALLKDGYSLTSLKIENGKVIVEAKSKNKGIYFASANHLIAADGANGQVSKYVDLRKNKVHAFALEVEHEYDWSKENPNLRKDILHLEYGLPGGYAWVFPKKNHINVGAGIFTTYLNETNKIENPTELLKEFIYNYLNMLDVPFEKEKMHFYGHKLPLWNGKENLQTKDGIVLLVGDAAGLINPLFGDGILHAVKSGIIAGQCIESGDVKNYTRKIHEEFSSDFNNAKRLSPLFYKHTNFIYENAVKRSRATRVAAELLAGELSFNDVVNRVLKRFTQFVNLS